MKVHEAWACVMADVQAVRKDGFNKQQGFNFRGIDAVMSAVGPALRTHGVTVLPSIDDLAIRHYQTSKGTQMKETTVWVTFTVYGPEGDSFAGKVPGESADSGDKSTAKAMSVAYRTFLLQALTIPTDDPDPDQSSHERAPEVDGRVQEIASTINAWGARDPRLQEMSDARAEHGWPAKLGDYDDTQLDAAVALVRRLNAHPDGVSGPQPHVEDDQPPAVPPAREHGQEDDGATAKAHTAAVAPPFTAEHAAAVTHEQITTTAKSMGLPVAEGGSKAQRLAALAALAALDDPADVVGLVTTITDNRKDNDDAR